MNAMCASMPPAGRTTAADFKINAYSHTIEGSAGTVHLTPREFDLLMYLMDNAGAPVSQLKLLQNAWGWDNADQIKTKTVEMHIRRLRTKLDTAGFGPNAIETIRGCGYRLALDRHVA